MHIDLDLKLTLDSDATTNENQLHRVFIQLTQLLAPSSSANVNLGIDLHTTPTVQVKPTATPQILRATELLTIAAPAASPEPTTQPDPRLAALITEPTPLTRARERLKESVLAPAPAATQAAEPAPAAAPRRGKPAGLTFEEYDRLVRAEMKRLSLGGVMPGYTYWEKARDPRLPTLLAIIRRYGFSNPAQLAEHLGYLAPEKSRRQPDQ